MPRSIAGQGRVMTRYPAPPNGTLLPSSSTTSASTPGNGNVALPGFSVVIPGSGVMRIIPVSVIHQVSTTGHRPPPMTSWYQSQASGLIGSPTEPRRRRLVMSCFCGYSGPHFMNVRIAVGAQYRIETLYFSMIAHQRSLSGKSGVPSYMTPVVPLASGPNTMYEWPVTQPMSAAHQYTSLSLMSKIILCVVATPVRYPAEVWTMPFGFAVVPEV